MPVTQNGHRRFRFYRRLSPVRSDATIRCSTARAPACPTPRCSPACLPSHLWCEWTGGSSTNRHTTGLLSLELEPGSGVTPIPTGRLTTDHAHLVAYFSAKRHRFTGPIRSVDRGPSLFSPSALETTRPTQAEQRFSQRRPPPSFRSHLSTVRA